LFRSRSEVEGGVRRFQSRSEAAGANLQFLAEYDTKKDEVIQVKIAVSAVSAENALKNLDAEIPDWNFAQVRGETRQKWDRELGKIRIEGTREEKKPLHGHVPRLLRRTSIRTATGVPRFRPQYASLRIHQLHHLFALGHFSATHPVRLDPSRRRRGSVPCRATTRASIVSCPSGRRKPSLVHDRLSCAPVVVDAYFWASRIRRPRAIGRSRSRHES
jgi:hypothetical protein